MNEIVDDFNRPLDFIRFDHWINLDLSHNNFHNIEFTGKFRSFENQALIGKV